MMVCFGIGKSALLIGFAAILLSFVSAANAQTFRGTLLGTVTDSSGAAVAGAAVAVKNVNTGLSRTVSTSAEVPTPFLNSPSAPIPSPWKKQGSSRALSALFAWRSRASCAPTWRFRLAKFHK